MWQFFLYFYFSLSEFISFERLKALINVGNQDAMPDLFKGKVSPVTQRPLPEKAFRRRKAGRYSVKKFALFERSEFADFRNIVWLFSFWRLWA